MNLRLQNLRIPYLPAGPSGVWGTVCDIPEGALIHLRARSGQGKSTLIHTLYGLQKEYSGDALWNDRPLRRFTPEEISQWRQNQTGIVFQDLRLFPQLSVADNLELKRQLTGFGSRKDADQMAERLGIGHLMQRSAGTLSYGERQRVAIIRALLQPFSLLLLDEPFSHLDEANIALAAALIAEGVQQRGATLFLADLEPDSRFPYTHRWTL
jgi:ABC-type lipoprotein export system ATPase subunit